VDVGAASKRSRCTAGGLQRRWIFARSKGTPARDHFAACRSASSGASRSGGTGPSPAGIEMFGVRWNAVGWRAFLAMIGIDWMPDEPVPLTATRLPLRSTPPSGQRLVEQTSPWSRPTQRAPAAGISARPTRFRCAAGTTA
jgi:hypothetical protein